MMMDITEAIKYELWSAREGKRALAGLSVGQMIEAFPDEIRLARRAMRTLRRELKTFDGQIIILKSLGYAADVEQFAIGTAVMFGPVAKIEYLAKLKAYGRAYKALLPPKEGETPRESISEVNVAQARSVQITGLFDWVKPKHVGHRFTACCPFHMESTPSFFVFRDNKFKCFSCAEHGDAIDFVMKTMGLDFVQGVKYLCHQ